MGTQDKILYIMSFKVSTYNNQDECLERSHNTNSSILLRAVLYDASKVTNQ